MNSYWGEKGTRGVEEAQSSVYFMENKDCCGLGNVKGPSLPTNEGHSPCGGSEVNLCCFLFIFVVCVQEWADLSQNLTISTIYKMRTK